MTDRGLDPARSARIRDINDAFRTFLDGGTVLVTRGIMDRGLNFHREVIAQVRGYAGFDAPDDPWSEHDFGVLTVRRQKVFFKIDYFDRDLALGFPRRRGPVGDLTGADDHAGRGITDTSRHYV